jgi:hypothetical protein
MPRVCGREGCGKRLETRNGLPEYRKHFCGRTCKNADAREGKQAIRERIRLGKCPLCGRRPPRSDAGHLRHSGFAPATFPFRVRQYSRGCSDQTLQEAGQRLSRWDASQRLRKNTGLVHICHSCDNRIKIELIAVASARWQQRRPFLRAYDSELHLWINGGRRN